MARHSWKLLVGGFLPALLCSTSVMAAGVSISGTVGVGSIELPELGSAFDASAANGSINDTAHPNTFGGTYLGLDGTIDIGPVGDKEGLVGFSIWDLSGLGGTSTATTTMSGAGVLVVPGFTTPNADIALTTSSGAGSAGATSSITQGNPPELNLATHPSSSGIDDDWAVNPGDGANDPSFAYGGVFTDGALNRAGAFGAVATPDGGIFIASGDLTGITVTTETSRDVSYAGGDLTFGLGQTTDKGAAIAAYAGPAVRSLNQSIGTDVTVDIPELTTPGTDEFPLYIMSRDEELDSTYFGGVIGFSASQPLGGNFSLDVNGEVGLYNVDTTYDGNESYTVTGGAPLSVDQTVDNANGASASSTDMAYSLGGNAALSMAINDSMQVSLGVGLDYLSKVATIQHPQATDVDSNLIGDDGVTGYNDSGQDLSPVIAFGSSWSWRLTGSLTGHF